MSTGPTPAPDLWRRSLPAVETAATVWTVQVATPWLTDPDHQRVRDDLDLVLFLRALKEQTGFCFRRVLLYDPPSDLGGAPDRYAAAQADHAAWIGRVRRHLAAIGAEGSAGGSLPDGCEYSVRLLILGRAGTRTAPAVEDGLWTEQTPPADVQAAWSDPRLIPLDPHEESIIGPHRDRNPLWQGAFLG
ncbi:hypothetical protein Ga0074812_10531 [Parafrankia irregularis]|uniref:Uncharacterized protein n=1 Tax=Parafrankia irregularis TaxID=795642 RepID=A0A0S4QLG3_9ACTN|nr:MULTISPECIES: hypothetical protein [Parafrankia]CUU55382.1 hypothetical protein Ga0074812_10531 [Parafrankia irregularis]